MKVLHIQFFEKVGGSERFIFQLAEQQIKYNLAVDVIFILNRESKIKYADYFNSFNSIKCNIVLIDWNKGLMGFCKIFFELRNYIKIISPEIIHLHLIQAEIYVAILKVLSLVKCKTIVQKHGYNEFTLIKYLNHDSINKYSKYWILSRISFLVHSKTYTISNYFSSFFYKIGISNKPLDYIYHGLFNVSDKRFEYNSCNEKYFCVVARLDPIKGHDLLIEAINYLFVKGFNIDFKVYFLGDGTEKKVLIRKINDLGLSDIILVKGYVNNVHEIIKNSIAVILPSKVEPFGLTLLEAYQNYKCTIAFDVPSLNEIIVEGETGYLISPYSVIDLAKKILFLSDNLQLAKCLGLNAGKYAREKFSLEKMVRQTLDIYNGTSD